MIDKWHHRRDTDLLRAEIAAQQQDRTDDQDRRGWIFLFIPMMAIHDIDQDHHHKDARDQPEKISQQIALEIV